MNYEYTLTKCVLMFVILYIMYYSIFCFFKGKIPFLLDISSKYKGYVNFTTIFKLGISSIFKLIMAVIITGIIYHSFKTTHIDISKSESNDELIFIILLLLASIISGLFISWFKSMGRFSNQLIIYILLKKNTVGNNLRHAIASKDQSEMVKYHKLIRQTDEIVTLSINEKLTLMASLMKAGIYEDVTQILSPQLKEKDSLFQNYMNIKPEILEYKINGIDKSIEKSETFKYKINIFQEKSQKIASLTMIALIIQFVIILLSSMGIISNIFKSIFIIAISISIISIVIIKYKKLKDIYKREFNKEKIELKEAPIDRIQLWLSVIMFGTGLAGLIFI